MESMKHLGLVWVLLLLGIGAIMGPATAQLTAGQSVPPSLNLGDSAMVTVTLTYYGNNATQAVITPGLPPEIETSYPQGQTAELYPGITAPISYPIRAIQSGTYIIASHVSYSEEGTWRNLWLESPLTVIGQPTPQPGQMDPAGMGPLSGDSPPDMNGSESYPPGSVPANQSVWEPNSPLPISPDDNGDAHPGDAPDLQDQTPDQMPETDKNRNH